VDHLLHAGAPLDAFGIQAHLQANDFADRFDAAAYARFLHELADRGLELIITELDVLDTGLPAEHRARDRGVADVYRRFLDVALAEPAVTTCLTFGLSDRYTWLQQAYPRHDHAKPRPLPFDRSLRPVPAYDALARSLANWREPA
jgi:endo-1,4-beta-xylanase